VAASLSLHRQQITVNAAEQSPAERKWIQDWGKERRTANALALLFQMYPGKIRGAQGYLTKMPSGFVKRWEPLAGLFEALER
jgi:hypothetical protein